MAQRPVELPSTQRHDERVAPAQADPYRYGWRYVSRRLDNGDEEWEQVPLTLYDVLHPQAGDQVTHSDDHQRFCIYLYNVLTGQLVGVEGAIVLHDVRAAWDVPELGAHGPDIAVIFGVRERRNWGTFDVAQEGPRPALVIEVTSPETRRLDLYDKVDAYDEAGVSLYIIIDTSTRKGVTTRRLLGYERTGAGYVSLAPDEAGRLWLEPVRLWLGLQDNQVVCYDEADHQLEEYAAVITSRAAEAAARQEAEARLQELEAELRRLRGQG